MRERTRPPTHPGGILKRHYLEPLHIGIAQAALALGVSRQSLSKIVHEQRAVTPDMALRLGKAFHTTPELWLHLPAADLRPVARRASVGGLASCPGACRRRVIPLHTVACRLHAPAEYAIEARWSAPRCNTTLPWPVPGAYSPGNKVLTVVHQERDLLRLERDLLRRELEAAQVREQAALEREQAVREREALLLCVVEQVQQQNQCLLDMPRILLLLRYQNLAPQQTLRSHVETCASGAQWI